MEMEEDVTTIYKRKSVPVQCDSTSIVARIKPLTLPLTLPLRTLNPTALDSPLNKPFKSA